MRPIIILAGCREEYEQWLEDNGHTSRTAVHGYDPERIVSVEASAIETIGTFWDRKDALKLEELARTRVRDSPADGQSK